MGLVLISAAGREGGRQARRARRTPCRRVSRNLPASAGRALRHTIDEKSTILELGGDTARAVVPTVANATVYGSRANRVLHPASDYVREDGPWVVPRTEATAW
ncbi:MULTISPECIES: hypothetical protein [unclassified Streptomyces]|uniref:hypothetical protein n=1 Tax=unclassified Streptomyces TaxID=2593676 RepID=UPI0033BE10B6